MQVRTTHLLETFHPTDYFVGCELGILSLSDFFEQVLPIVQNKLPKKLPFTDEQPVFKDYTLIHFVAMIHHQILFGDDIPYEDFEELPD